MKTFQAVGNYFHPQHLIGGSSEQKLAAERTIDITLEVYVDITVKLYDIGTFYQEEANWTTSWEKNLSNQALYNNVVKVIFVKLFLDKMIFFLLQEIFNALTRIIGWTAMSLVSLLCLQIGYLICYHFNSGTIWIHLWS